MTDYEQFILGKQQDSTDCGFTPTFIPDCAFDFQSSLIDWSIRKGKAAVLADCGLGKSLIELVFGENVIRHTNKPVLLLTPLAVGPQMIEEAEKFGIEAKRSRDGKAHKCITVTNYEQLDKFDPDDFGGAICDEAGCIKDFESKTRDKVVEFLRKIPYRLLATATAAPNDYTELGNHSEALGQLGYMDMLTRFFKNDRNNCSSTGHKLNDGWSQIQWRFKGHAEIPFWRWVCSWARAIRKPSDLGFEDRDFVLPPLQENLHVVDAHTLKPGFLFQVPARGLKEEREERRRTLNERCEKAAALCEGRDYSVVWCHLNPEGDLLEKLIPDAVQVSGSMSDDEKEEKLTAFRHGQIKRLVSKAKIAGWGQNWQHCNHTVTFVGHSFESDYQCVRRFWRFGQKRNVIVDRVATKGEQNVVKNLKRKQSQAEEMFRNLVSMMNDSIRIDRSVNFTKQQEMPQWLFSTK